VRTIIPTKTLKLLALVFLLTTICWSVPAQALTPTSVEPTASAEISDAQKRQESFEIVWKTVNERFFDPTFGGVDWQKVRERYAPLVAGASSDQEVHRLLQQMINELHQSHFVIIPREAIPRLIPKRKRPAADGSGERDDEEILEELEDDESTTPLDRLGYKLTERLSTGIGIDLRVIKGMAVITHVEPQSAAARARLHPGFVIKSVDGRSVADVISHFENNSTFKSVFRGELPLIILGAFINGERRSPVRLTYLDGRNRILTKSITREKLKGEMAPGLGNLPALFTEFESRVLAGGIGYIRFNAFMPSVMKKVCGALRAQRNAPGLILDLRGNQGGLLGMISGMSGLLESEPIVIGRMQSRSGGGAMLAYPQRSPYAGPIVILVDSATQSAAEMFASALQANGRATIVGEKSAGNTLPSAIVKLPTGALFQYGFADFKTVNGDRLEGRGIIPDINVELTRRNLLAGPDPQMKAALKKIRELAFPSPELIADVSVTTPSETTRESKPSTAKVEVPSPPPPAGPKPKQAPVVIAEVPSAERAKPRNGPVLPSVDEVVDHYLSAIGGQAALEKLSSRVSRGKVELQSMGLTGTAEIYEQAPNKSTLIINVEGLGTIQQTYDGVKAWLQDPLDGYIKFAPTSASRIRSQSIFQRELRFKELNPRLSVIGKEKIAGREAYVVLSSTAMGTVKFFFDVSSGLLLRRDNTNYDDYREVDGVKLPFKITDDTSYGFGVVVSLTEIKHNVPIDQTKFMEYPDCFTRPEEDWTKK